MVSGWKCNVWKQRLEKANQDLQENKTTADQVALLEEDVAKEVYQAIQKEITYDDVNDLAKIVRDKKANCLGYSIFFYILSNSIGLSVDVVHAVETSSGLFLNGGGHSACLINLKDGKVIMLDLAYQFVSKPFAFKKEFSEVGNYWELQDKNSPWPIIAEFNSGIRMD